MPTVKYTHLVIDPLSTVHVWAVSPDYAERQAVNLAVTTGRTMEVVELATADIATLARIAERDQPNLARKGGGLLGAGTHPAQPYLEVMLQMRGVTADKVPGLTFGWDRAADILNAFVSNAGSGWRGETAAAVKATLKAMAVKR